MPVPSGTPSESSLAATDDGDEEEDDGDEMAADGASPAPAGEAPVAAGSAERSAFSLFSWLRREPDDKKP
jgi:hypothetical protein